jgi:hypothetical protein
MATLYVKRVIASSVENSEKFTTGFQAQCTKLPSGASVDLRNIFEDYGQLLVLAPLRGQVISVLWCACSRDLRELCVHLHVS